jgi:hypothetical protein
MTYSELYDNYRNERKTVLSENQFASLLLMYPSVLVAYADNDFDALERQNLAISCSSAAGDDKLFAAELYCELMYTITADGEKWKSIFLEVIKANLASDSDSAQIVNDLMISMAESSDGISDEEQAVIDFVKSSLNI